MISCVVPVAICVVNRHPTLERTMFGLYRSDFGLAIITASRFAASAVRSNAPMFPGFSGASAMSINGVWDNFKSDKRKGFVLATAKIPSVVSR